MLSQVLSVFDIDPDVGLQLMEPDQALSGLTARALEALDGYLASERPELVLVQGDTTTAFSAALAAFYRKIPVGHVEAGLRTGNLCAPWPEEGNRLLVSRLAAFHFAPTMANRQNLIREGVNRSHVFVTGNTVIDALALALKKVRVSPPEIETLPSFLQPGSLGPRVVLITGHRRESFGRGFDNICQAISQLAQQFPDTHFVYPVHLNPNVQDTVNRHFREAPGVGATGPTRRENVHLIEPLGYLAFVALMDRSHIVLTDSGGIQEEAPSLGKPVLVMRDTTERPEALAAGTARLVGTTVETICAETRRLLEDDVAYSAMKSERNPYGDGQASIRICGVLKGI